MVYFDQSSLTAETDVTFLFFSVELAAMEFNEMPHGIHRIFHGKYGP